MYHKRLKKSIKTRLKRDFRESLERPIRILKLGGDTQKMYIRNEWHLGRVIQVEQHYPGNYGAPGMPRQPKRERTPEDIARQNRTNRAKKIQRLILANFDTGDWHLVLKYRPGTRPEEYEEAQKILKKFLSDMRKVYKRAGYEFKYIAVTERGKKGNALHHHLVIQDICSSNLNTVKAVKELWPGYQAFIDLYEDGDYEKLAEYIVKTDTKEEQEKGKSTYSRSRNLITPKPRRKKLMRRRWPEEPKPKKGYYIERNSIVNGINPVTGYPYQHYTMRMIDPGGDSG